jgi:fatty-acyl-CoA synthase
MKLSFSTKGWNCDWNTFCEKAVENGFDGIEIHNIHHSAFTEKTAVFDRKMLRATARNLQQMKLQISCIDSICDICSCDNDTARKEITACIEAASVLRVPYVRLRVADGDADTIYENAKALLSTLLPMAEAVDVTLLIETAGVFSNTTLLKQLLNSFANDHLAALWDMYHTFYDGAETPEQTVKALGAYIRHVHIKDAQRTENGFEYCLIGEGELPLPDLMIALRSINYDGFMSLEWDPEWLPDLTDMDVIFLHFTNYMAQFAKEERKQKKLYENKLHTGKFVWQKEALVHLTFSQVLDRMVEEFPDQYAIKYTTLDYTRTYAQFRDDVDECARALVALGVRAGSHVAIWATNLPQWFITFWATVKIGAVLVTVNTAYKVHEIEYLLSQSDTHTLVMMENWRDADYAGIIKELCPELATMKKGEALHSTRLPFLRNVITVGFSMPGCLTWEEALRKADEVPQEEILRMAAKVSPQDVCNMQYTSGTTGFPKGVMLTHYNVVNNGKCIGDRMDLSTADRMMIQVPMFHCFGMVLSMTASMTHGATISPIPYFSPKSSLACINQERITCFNGVPTMFIAMFNHPDYVKTDFSYMRTGIMAGANCPADLMRRAARPDGMNMRGIVSVYGQTEASPGCTMSELDDDLNLRCDTVGYAFPNVECKIIDPETGKDLPDGENGEFVARGYNIMKGYYKMPTATAAAIDEDGWLHSGDIACRAPDGTYRITGRLKDMIIRGGENIYPKEIEEFLYTNEKIRDVQVIGVPDKQYGEEILASIILKEGKEATEAEIKEYVASHMARHKVPRYVDFVKAFPMNAAGKILKYKMREEAAKKFGIQE